MRSTVWEESKNKIAIFRTLLKVKIEERVDQRNVSQKDSVPPTRAVLLLVLDRKSLYLSIVKVYITVVTYRILISDHFLYRKNQITFITNSGG